jgi:hypothetical protein
MNQNSSGLKPEAAAVIGFARCFIRGDPRYGQVFDGVEYGLPPNVPADGAGVNESGEEFIKESIAHVFPLARCNESKRLARNAGRQIRRVFVIRGKKNFCGKSKRSEFEPLSHSWQDGGREVLRVIVPKVCQPLIRYYDYFYLNTYPYGSP